MIILKAKWINLLSLLDRYESSYKDSLLLLLNELREELDESALELVDHYTDNYERGSYSEFMPHVETLLQMKELSEGLIEIQTHFQELRENPSMVQAHQQVVTDRPKKYLSGEELKQLKSKPQPEKNRTRQTEYTVQTMPPYSLIEKYTLTLNENCVFSGEIQGINALVVKLCEHLISLDALKVNRMPNEPRFNNGQPQHNYFRFVNLNEVPMVKIPNSCLYVETHLEDSTAKQLIVDLLNYFELPVHALKVMIQKEGGLI